MKRLVKVLMMVFIASVFMCVEAYAASDETSLPYEVKKGSLYYESSWGFGSGKYDVVESENQYTDVPCMVGINGYSFLDENGQVISSKFEEEEIDIEIPEMPAQATQLWVHFSGPVYRNGWTKYTNIMSAEGLKVEDESEPEGKNEVVITIEEVISAIIEEEKAEQTPEEIVEQIEVIAQHFKTAIVVDSSGSMDDNQKQVIRQLSKLDFTDDTIIVVFGTEYQEVSYQDLINRNYYVSATTNIYGTLNYVAEQGVETIVLISDMMDNENKELFSNNSVKGLVIYNPEDWFHQDVLDVIKDKWKSEIFTYTIE